jgi:hypothetical protein
MTCVPAREKQNRSNSLFTWEYLHTSLLTTVSARRFLSLGQYLLRSHCVLTHGFRMRGRCHCAPMNPKQIPMLGYSPINDASTNHEHQDVEDVNDDVGGRPPFLFSTPAVEAPLITWFGLPTLVECEQSTSTTSSGPNGAVIIREEGIEEDEIEEEGREFSPLIGWTRKSHHVRSLSRPPSSHRQQGLEVGRSVSSCPFASVGTSTPYG